VHILTPIQQSILTHCLSDINLCQPRCFGRTKEYQFRVLTRSNLHSRRFSWKSFRIYQHQHHHLGASRVLSLPLIPLSLSEIQYGGEVSPRDRRSGDTEFAGISSAGLPRVQHRFRIHEPFSPRPARAAVHKTFERSKA
jgi:hypothetical protein